MSFKLLIFYQLISLKGDDAVIHWRNGLHLQILQLVNSHSGAE